MDRFIDDNFAGYITKFVRTTILPNLNDSEFELVIKLLIDLIEYISIRFNFDLSNKGDYEYQLKQNKNKDLIAIFNLLLPYIDDAGGSYANHHKITSLKDITTLKNPNIKGTDAEVHFPKDDIHKNPYELTNLQYGHALLYDNHIKSGYTKSPYVYEHEFGEQDLVSNFHILIASIDQMSHKLYINWLNTRPIHPKKYKESRLYKASYKYMKDEYDRVEKGNEPNGKGKFRVPNEDGDIMLVSINQQIYRYSGISIGDYYNVIHHDLYFAVRDFKWLIYEHKNNDYELYLNTFLKKFTGMIDKIKENIYYSEIDEKNVESWNSAKNNFVSSLKEDAPEYSICYNILYYLQRKYSDRDDMDGYVILKISTNNTDEEDEDLGILEEIEEDYAINKKKLPNIEDIITSWNSLSMKHLYGYIYETINKFRKTWYGYQIVELGNNNPKIDGKELVEDGYKVSFKDIYNFSKSVLIAIFSNNINSERKSGLVERLSKYRSYKWYDLSAHNLDDGENIKNPVLFAQQEKFYNILNNYNSEKGWFNIKNIIKKNKKEGPEIMEKIKQSIFQNLTDIVFECLIYDGLLCEFVVDKFCTDKQIYDTKKTRREFINRRIFNDENVAVYKECIYYVTGDTFGKLPLMIEKEKTETYFDWLKHEEWYMYYAMDWVSQISFYHKYINNRVMLVTGATGAGKSTQVPKLLLYGLKMINFNYQGKVVSTQPRIAPTRGNAERISDEMGISIKSYSRAFDKKISNFMGNIQYKTANDSHLNEAEKYYLKEMTDGSLVEELYSNPLLKQHIAEKNEKKRDEFNYGITNKYDIVVIDESHEHNKNMDIILTLMKYALYWNNSLKLVIVSATMEEDEPIYRRYYKSILDDNMYPFNLYNRSNPYHNTKPPNLIDIIDENSEFGWSGIVSRLFLDRRIHISPPGESTQHKIVDTYLAQDTKEYKDAEEEGVKQLYKILDSNMPGDILFFTHGTKPIEELVTKFNKTTPQNVIALPFHSKIPQEWQTYAEKTEKIGSLTVHKEDVYAEIKEKGSGTYSKVGEGTYNRVIIVATNVAEASITINNLKHVIDTGYYNSVVFDTVNNKTVQKIAMITEASRKQRRGRVGRRSSGWVWYMYAKGSREDIVPAYNICTSDIRTDLMKMMRTDNTETLLVPKFMNNIHSNCLSEDYENDYENLEDIELVKMSYEVLYKSDGEFEKSDSKYGKLWKTTKKILKYHHTIQAIDDENYYYFNNYSRTNDQKNINSSGGGFLKGILGMTDIPERYETGYSMNTILDFVGSFHIIHPGETTIRRNLLTGIIQLIMYEKYNMHNELRAFIGKTISPIESLYYSRQIVADTTKNIGQLLQVPHIIKNLVYNTNKRLEAKYSPFYKNYGEDNETEIFFKTNFGKNTDKIARLLKIDEMPGLEQVDATIKNGCLIALIYGILFEIPENICGIISVLFAFGADISGVMTKKIVNGKPRIDYQINPLDSFRSIEGDLITFNNIFEGFRRAFPNIINPETTTMVETKEYDTDKSAYLDLKNKMMTQIKNKQNPWDTITIDKELFTAMQKIDQTGNLNDKSGKTKYKEYKKKSIRGSTTDNDIKNILIWASIRKLPDDKVKNMLRYYKFLWNKVEQILKEDDMKWFRYNVPLFKGKTLNENIIKCFLYGFSRNVYVYKDGNYIDLYTAKKDDGINISKSQNLNKMPNNEYIMFITSNDKGEPSNINKIELNWLIEYIPDIITPNILQPSTTTDYGVYVDIARAPHTAILEKYSTANLVTAPKMDKYIDQNSKSDKKEDAELHNNNLRKLFHSKLYGDSY